MVPEHAGGSSACRILDETAPIVVWSRGRCDMGRYMLAFRGGTEPETPEQATLLQAAWSDWLAGLGPALADPGGPFRSSARVAVGRIVSEGGTSGLSGFTIVTADSISAAAELAAESPIFAGDGEVDVYETIEM